MPKQRQVSTLCLCAGSLLVTCWAVPTAWGTLLSRLSVVRFRIDHADGGRWSSDRILAYSSALRVAMPQPEAILRIPSAGMEVPVFNGTSELVLNRGTGLVEGTARPGERGNTVIAGHRDGFFRALRNVAVGDTIKVSRSDSTYAYRVASLQVVSPSDTSVLRPQTEPILTLVPG